MIKLQPVFKDYLWGGTRLKSDFGYKTDYDVIAESWVASIHKDGLSIVENDGRTFRQYLEDNPGFLGKDVKEFPVLIKFIDSAKPLSIQVHPYEEYAQKYEHDHGKTEAWYIMDCEPDAFIYYGVNQELTREQFRKAIEENKVLEVLNKVEVKKGDCFLIEAGTIHAVGAGIMLCEVQQNSNATYRVYDYMRKDKNGNYRQLHIDKAVDVSTLKPLENTDGINAEGKPVTLVDCPLFVEKYLPVNGEEKIETTAESFTSITFLSGEGEICADGEAMKYQKGDSFVVKAEEGCVSVKGTGECIVVTAAK